MIHEVEGSLWVSNKIIPMYIKRLRLRICQL